MARTGIAKGGVAKGHATTERVLKPKPSRRKGVRRYSDLCWRICAFVSIIDHD